MKLCLTRFALAIVLLTAIGASGIAQPPPPKPLPFRPGETLTYEVKWSIFPAGKLTATLGREKNGHSNALVITTKARSQGFVSLLYKVQDEFRSVFNPETLCSIQITKQINEGPRHKLTKITFDRQRGLAVLNEHGTDGDDEPPKHAEHPIPPCVQDIITAFYYVRSQPLRVGQDVRLAVNDGSKTTMVVAAVTGRKKIQTPLGTHEALRVVPSVFGNLYKKKKGKLVIWFSDDRHHYPLRIKASLKLGSITGTLVSVSPAPPGYFPANKTAKDQRGKALK